MAAELILDTIYSRNIRPDKSPKQTQHRIIAGAQVNVPGHSETAPSRMHPGKLPVKERDMTREIVVTDYDFALSVLAFLREQFKPRPNPHRMNCHGLVRFAVLCALGRTFDLGPDDQLPDSVRLGPPIEKTQGLPPGTPVVFKLEDGYIDPVTKDRINLAHSALTLDDGPDLLQMTGMGGWPALAPADDWASHLERQWPDAGSVTVHPASYVP